MPTRRKKRGTRIKLNKNRIDIYLHDADDSLCESNDNPIIPKQSIINNNDLGYIIESKPSEISESDFEKLILDTEIKSKNEFDIEQEQLINEHIIRINNEELNRIDKVDSIEQSRIETLNCLLKESKDDQTRSYILEEIKLIETKQSQSEEEYEYDTQSESDSENYDL